MFLYNVTIIAENDVHEAVKQRIAAQLVGHVGVGTSVSLLEMLDSPHDGKTYCLQLRAGHEAEINAFRSEHLEPIVTSLNRDFAGKAVSFESIMKYLPL